MINTVDNTPKPKLPVDSIAMPVAFQRLCIHWAGGEDCMLRAVSSSGGLTIGTTRPRGCDSEEKWYLTIWRVLSCDVGRCRRMAGDGDPDYDLLSDFEDWTEEMADRLEESYGLADWDACDE